MSARKLAEELWDTVYNNTDIVSIEDFERAIEPVLREAAEDMRERAALAVEKRGEEKCRNLAVTYDFIDAIRGLPARKGEP